MERSQSLVLVSKLLEGNGFALELFLLLRDGTVSEVLRNVYGVELRC